jgi:drug/metabolite transporter (DMT)-like permease
VRRARTASTDASGTAGRRRPPRRLRRAAETGDPILWLAVGGAVLGSASGYTATVIGLGGYAPGPLSLLRFLAASAAVTGWVAVRGVPRPPLRDVPVLLLAGLLAFSVFSVALARGQQTVPVGTASVIVATIPACTAVLATALLGERPGARSWVGVAVSFVGVGAIAVGQGAGFGLAPGVGHVLLATASASAYFVLSKAALRRWRPVEFTAWAVWAGTLFLLPYAPALAAGLPRASLAASLAAVWLGVVSPTRASRSRSRACPRRAPSRSSR